MITKVMEKKKLQKFLSNLCNQKLFAPLKDEEGKINFGLVKDPAEVVLEFANVLKPVKSLLFPQTETIFEADEQGIHHPEVSENGVIFGLRPCDAKSVRLLRKVFEKDYKDNYFLQREGSYLKIGLACTVPGENCFCTSFGQGPFFNEGLDLLLADIGEKYYVEVLSEKGKKLVEENSELFLEPTEADMELRQIAQANAEGKIGREVNVKRASEKLGQAYDNALWDETSKICIGCGICAYLCPTCHCFDMTDEKVASRTRRIRTWDTCMFSYFTLQASGHNPRPTKKERLRNRVYHKFKYLLENFDEIGCVGCGRCLENCPSGVNLIEILSRVAES